MSNKGKTNRRTAIILGGVVFGMLGMAYAAVPLYRIFCQVTGYGGTTGVAAAADKIVAEREIAVRFNADHAANLPWSFKPEQREVRIKVGETGLAFFAAENFGKKAITGSAVYNVTPQKAGEYFNKIQCFCFTEQTLQPGEKVDMGVSFFVDPEIINDHDLDDVKTITLSYSFYRKDDDKAAEPVSGP